MSKYINILFLYILGIMLISSCCTYKRCSEKYFPNRKDTIYVPFKVSIPYQKVIPANSLTASINLDSLCAKRDIKDSTISIKINDSKTKLSLEYWRVNDNLMLKAFNPPDTIRDTIISEFQVPCPPCPPEKPITKWDIFLNQYKTAAGWVAPFLFAFFVVIIILIFKK